MAPVDVIVVLAKTAYVAAIPRKGGSVCGGGNGVADSRAVAEGRHDSNTVCVEVIDGDAVVDNDVVVLLMEIVGVMRFVQHRSVTTARCSMIAQVAIRSVVSVPDDCTPHHAAARRSVSITLRYFNICIGLIFTCCINNHVERSRVHEYCMRRLYGRLSE